MVSVATTGLYIAYALPIFFRVTTARKSFVPGPFNLGRYGLAVGWVAVAWVALVTVLFCLPVAYPITEHNLNYTPGSGLKVPSSTSTPSFLGGRPVSSSLSAGDRPVQVNWSGRFMCSEILV